MASYNSFTVVRTTEPDQATLLAQLRALDATVGVQHVAGTQIYTLKKNTPWLAAHITAAANVLESAPTASASLAAQAEIDRLSIVERAIILTILDQFNVIRGALVPPLAPITPAQMIAAVRTKAGTL